MFVSQKTHVEILMPNVMVLGDGNFERYLSHEGGTFMNGNNTLKKEVPDKSLAPATMWRHNEKAPSMN